MKAISLWLFLLPAAWCGQVYLHINLDAAGTISATVNSRDSRPFDRVLAAALGCKIQSRGTQDYGNFRCTAGMRRDGLTFSMTLDLEPFRGDDVSLYVVYPSAGFHESTAGGTFESSIGETIYQHWAIPADSAVPSVKIRFGYQLSKLPAMYWPMLPALLALVLIPALAGRRGYSHVTRSFYILGASLWMALNWSLGASGPIEMLLAGTGLSNFVSVAWSFLVPLLAVAAGVKLGRKPGESQESATSFLWSYGALILPLACGMVALPSVVSDGWWAAAPWLIAAAAMLLAARLRVKRRGGQFVRVTTGPLKDRADALGRRAGFPQASVLVSCAPGQGPKHANAFAVLQGSVVLTAPLLRLFPRCEIDAVIAHEMSHFRRRGRFHVFMVLLLASVMFNTILASQVSVLVHPSIVLGVAFVAALFFSRRREYAADRGAAMLTGDPRSMMGALARLQRFHEKPFEMSFWIELLSTHPSTGKRIRAIAAASGVPAMSALDLPEVVETYDVPDATFGGTIFNAAWQRANTRRYGLAIMLTVPSVALAVALLLERVPVDFPIQLTGGIVFGCLLTKLIVMAVMQRGHAALARKLARTLETSGMLVGMAPGGEPRTFDGLRYLDAGLFSLDAGRMRYRSERTTIELNPGDVTGAALITAAPGSWARRQPMVQFRDPVSGESRAFILHPLVWNITGGRLFRQIEQWRASGTTSTTPAVVHGFDEPLGQPLRRTTMQEAWRGFRFAGGLALIGAMLIGWPVQPNAPSGLYVLAVAASGYAAIFLPLMLYKKNR